MEADHYTAIDADIIKRREEAAELVSLRAQLAASGAQLEVARKVLISLLRDIGILNSDTDPSWPEVLLAAEDAQEYVKRVAVSQEKVKELAEKMENYYLQAVDRALRLACSEAQVQEMEAQLAASQEKVKELEADNDWQSVSLELRSDHIQDLEVRLSEANAKIEKLRVALESAMRTTIMGGGQPRTYWAIPERAYLEALR